MIIVQLIVFKFHLRFYSICNRTNYFKCTLTFFKIQGQCRNKKYAFHDNSRIEYFDISSSKYLSGAVW